ncbi:post-transcriptional regulator MKT1L [Drosophila eugracilis]|uniref:post-transcriptional regulator MKT1L n=1 Tax=Drosophila eugracilis TaxID=29029 RepID=UPI0007E844ED|nr:post-transcriptional regulator MKT1L [Drosophila eugracilis]
MVWNGLSFWDGQPVTSPVYPQIGDMMNPNATGYQQQLPQPSQHHHHQQQQHQHEHHHHHHHPHPHPHSQPHPNPSCYQRMGMGDFRMMSCPMPNYYPQFREPCLNDGEAFCAYNGISQGYGEGLRPGAEFGTRTGDRGDFW